MAAAPKYKIYSANGKYVASCHYAEDAAVLVGISYPDGGTVRLGHGKILWTNGEGFDSKGIARDGMAADSYDRAAMMIVERERAIRQENAYEPDGVTSVPGFGSISL